MTLTSSPKALGDRKNKDNYRDIHMEQHSLKIWEATVLKAYGEEIDQKITPINKGFVSGKSCLDCVKEL